MLFELGCKFTLQYFLIGCIGGLAAVMTLPGSYIIWPRIQKVGDEKRIYLGFLARIAVAGVIGCVVDCNNRNVFFGGFFSWHICRYAQEDGWKWLKGILQSWFSKRSG